MVGGGRVFWAKMTMQSPSGEWGSPYQTCTPPAPCFYLPIPRTKLGELIAQEMWAGPALMGRLDSAGIRTSLSSGANKNSYLQASQKLWSSHPTGAGRADSKAGPVSLAYSTAKLLG